MPVQPFPNRLHPLPPNTWQLLGHRGARAEALENSALAFAHAQQLDIQGKKLDGVEFDIQMTADGEFVVTHDEKLSRLAGQQGWVSDYRLAKLRALYQSDIPRFQTTLNTNFLRQKILPLCDLPPYLQHYRHLEFEIKTHAKTQHSQLVENLLRLLSTATWQTLPISLTSFDTQILDQLQRQQAYLPPSLRYPTGLLLEPSSTLATQVAFLPSQDKHGEMLIYDTFNLACRLGCQQVGVYYPLINAKLINIARGFGLRVSAWTVNDPNCVKRLLDDGVNCVITDTPTTLLTAPLLMSHLYQRH